MECFCHKELIANVPPYLQHFLRQPYQSKGNHWATGDSSLMNSDLTVALHHLFLLMTGYPPPKTRSFDSGVRASQKLYSTML